MQSNAQKRKPTSQEPGHLPVRLGSIKTVQAENLPLSHVEKDRLISIAEVIGIVGISRTSIYAMIAAGRFPRQVRVGFRSVRWVEREVQAWLQTCKEVRDAEQET